MPNMKSAVKRVKTSEKRRLANKSVASRIGTVRRKLYDVIASGDKAVAAETARTYHSALDKAVKKGVLTRNAVGRRKSTVAKKLASM